MKKFIEHFVRDEDASWRCIEAVEFASPLGRIQIPAGKRFNPGVMFMGVDIAEALDHQYEDRPSPGLAEDRAE